MTELVGHPDYESRSELVVFWDHKLKRKLRGLRFSDYLFHQIGLVTSHLFIVWLILKLITPMRNDTCLICTLRRCRSSPDVTHHRGDEECLFDFPVYGRY